MVRAPRRFPGHRPRGVSPSPELADGSSSARRGPAGQRAETGSTRSNLLLSFTEPWIFDHPISGGVDVYRTERDKARDTGYAYDEEKVGGGLRFGKQFTEFVSAGVSYKIEEVTIENLDLDVSAEFNSFQYCPIRNQ